MKRFAALPLLLCLVLSACSDKNELPKMSEITVSNEITQAQATALGHDIDPQAVQMGTKGVPFFFSPKAEAVTFTPYESFVRLDGRYLNYKDVCYLSYTCSGVSFTMTGDKIEAVMSSNGGVYSDRQQGWVGVIIDGEITKKIKLDDGEQSYVLYEGDEIENAEVSIIKLSENQMAVTGIKNITCNAKRLSAASEKERSIEFIGDSITCGYGNEGDSEDDGFDTATQNGAATYGYLTAKNIDAYYSIIGISGIGLISDYTDETGVKEDYLLMDEVYEYADTNFEMRRGFEEYTQWDFNGGSDIVVINLGTNDYTYTGKDEDRQYEFYSAYYDFIGKVRKNNPNADIICSLGVMGSELLEKIQQAADDFCEDNGDKKVYVLKLDYQSEENGYGSDFHPTVKTHEDIARQLSEFIDEIVEK